MDERAASAGARGRGIDRLLDRMQRRVQVTPARLARWLAIALAVLVPSTAWGVATASAEASLGPHVARYEVTVDHEVTVDLGPLGTLVIDSPLPLMLGVRIVVQEIPREITAVQGADTLEALGADLDGYVQFFSAPSATLEVAVRALVVDAVRRSLLAAALVGALAWVLWSVPGPARRRELGGRLRPHVPAIAGGCALVLVATATLTASDRTATQSPLARQASAVFDGTPLEGARITGRLAGVIDTYGGFVVDAYQENEEFYADATANLEVAWQARAESDAELQRLREATRNLTVPDSEVLPAPEGPPVAPEPDVQDESGDADQDVPDGSAPTAGATGGPDADGGEQPGTQDEVAQEDAAQDEAEEDDELRDDVEAGPVAEPIVLLVVSDLHCNVGMAPVIEAAAELSGAQVILNAGDTTVNGTAVESYCVEAFGQAVPEGATMVVADGNHDSGQTADQERAAGAQVLDGDVVDVHGIRILGDRDPRATRIGGGTTLVGEETVPEAAERMADVACRHEPGVDLLLVHDPGMGEVALEQGCVPAQVSGHMHRRLGPTRVGEGFMYVSSSTAGASLGRPTLGPLSGVAEMTVLRFDPEERQLLDYRLIQVGPDAQARVGFAVQWPGAVRQAPPLDGPR